MGEWIQHDRREDLVVSRQLVASLDALGADIYWLTSWSHSANSILCPFIDWPPKKVLEKQTVKHWWKLGAAQEFLASSPHGRVAWIDDDLDQYRDEVEVRLGRLVEAGRLLLVCTESSTGLTRRQVEAMGAFALGQLAAAAWLTATLQRPLRPLSGVHNPYILTFNASLCSYTTPS